MSRDAHATEARTVGDHEAIIWKVSGPGHLKERTPMCSCGWQGEGHGRIEGSRGHLAALFERDAHLAGVST